MNLSFSEMTDDSKDATDDAAAPKQVMTRSLTFANGPTKNKRNVARPQRSVTFVADPTKKATASSDLRI
jgi:hypothetical protein